LKENAELQNQKKFPAFLDCVDIRI
jgi:hypothetical protein